MNLDFSSQEPRATRKKTGQLVPAEVPAFADSKQNTVPRKSMPIFQPSSELKKARTVAPTKNPEGQIQQIRKYRKSRTNIVYSPDQNQAQATIAGAKKSDKDGGSPWEVDIASSIFPKVDTTIESSLSSFSPNSPTRNLKQREGIKRQGTATFPDLRSPSSELSNKAAKHFESPLKEGASWLGVLNSRLQQFVSETVESTVSIFKKQVKGPPRDSVVSFKRTSMKTPELPLALPSTESEMEQLGQTYIVAFIVCKTVGLAIEAFGAAAGEGSSRAGFLALLGALAVTGATRLRDFQFFSWTLSTHQITGLLVAAIAGMLATEGSEQLALFLSYGTRTLPQLKMPIDELTVFTAALLVRFLTVEQGTIFSTAVILLNLGLALLFMKALINGQDNLKASEEALLRKNKETKADFDEVIFGLQKGLIIYTLDKNESPPRLTVRLMNKEFLKVLNQTASASHKAALFDRPLFRSVNFQMDGASRIDLARPLTLSQIMRSFKGKAKVQYYSMEVSKEVPVATGDAASDSTTRTFDLSNIEMTFKEIKYEGTAALLLTVANINSIIECQNQKLRQRYEEAFTATMSHEQMNPLNSIINFTDYLCTKTLSILDVDRVSSDSSSSDSSDCSRQMVSVDEGYLKKQFKYLTQIKSSSEMLHLINCAMLNLALIKQGNYDPSFTVETSLKEILEPFTKIFSSFIKRKRLRLIIQESSEEAFIKMVRERGILLDKKLYLQIVYNIFMNACKYSTQMGSIKIEVSAEEDKAASMQFNQGETTDSSQPKSMTLITTVTDTGIGIADAKKDKLFKLFEGIKQNLNVGQYRDPASTTQGQGLGLYLSMTLASFFDGDISIDSKVNQGTSVTIRIKVSLNPQLFERQSSLGSQQPGCTLRHIPKIIVPNREMNFMKAARSPHSSNFLSSSIENAFEEILRNQRIYSRASINKRNSAFAMRSSYRNSLSVMQRSSSIFSSNKLINIFPLMEQSKAFSMSSSTSHRIAPQQTNRSFSIPSNSPKSPEQQRKRNLSFLSVQSKTDDKANIEEKNQRRASQFYRGLTFNPSRAVSESSDEGSQTSSLKTDPISEEDIPEFDSIHQVMPVQTEEVMMTEEPEITGLDQLALQNYFNSPHISKETLDQPAAEITSVTSIENEDSDTNHLACPMRQPQAPERKSLSLPNLSQLTRELEAIRELPEESSSTFVQRKIAFVAPSINAELGEEEKKEEQPQFRLVQDATPPQDSHTGCKCRGSPILIVDDNMFNLEALKMQIKEHLKTTPEMAVDGKDAVDKFSAKTQNRTCCQECNLQPYRLIFMDLNMPVMDGIDATSKIKSLHQNLLQRGQVTHDCRIVALTAFVNSENIKRCHQVGIEKVLNKPANLKQIKELVLETCPFLEKKN